MLSIDISSVNAVSVTWLVFHFFCSFFTFTTSVINRNFLMIVSRFFVNRTSNYRRLSLLHNLSKDPRTIQQSKQRSHSSIFCEAWAKNWLWRCLFETSPRRNESKGIEFWDTIQVRDYFTLFFFPLFSHFHVSIVFQHWFWKKKLVFLILRHIALNCLVALFESV
jgi:hypothetical protein